VEGVDSLVTSARRFSFALLVAAVYMAACQRAGSQQQVITAGFWFDGLTAASVSVVSDRFGTALTAADFGAIESVARAELRVAFDNTRLQFTTSPPSLYRVRVLPNLVRTRTLPAAGESRSFGGIGGDGVVSFNTVALTALAYAPDAADRETLLDAIGRGIGRTAVHEFAHQILGPAAMDGTADLLSYEHADLRAEHFYATLHWGPAASQLQQRVGLPGHSLLNLQR
jgi:hypothetical protein